MKLLHFRDWSLSVKVLVVLAIFSTVPLSLAYLISDGMLKRSRERVCQFVLKSTVEDVQDNIRHFHEKHLNEAKRVANWPPYQRYANAPRAVRENPNGFMDGDRPFTDTTKRTMIVIEDSYK